MTCFWDGILNALEPNDFTMLSKTYGRFTVHTKPTNKNFVKLLKENNSKTNHIKWQGNVLSDKELNENFIHIKNFDENSISKGYYCSTCDPFLCLISKIFKVNIIHKYLKNTIEYTNTSSKKTIHFSSNRGHFWKT